MASAEQLKALLRSHLEGDNDRFISVAMQVAAHEARLGHGKLATDLRDMIDQAKSRRGAGSPVPIGRPRGELANLLEASYPKSRLGDMILGETLADRIKRVIREQRHADQTRGVYFFDEFDAIGSERAIANDVGEIRRVLNSFLQMIEQDRSHSMVVAATNHPGILDRALFRRFDDILHFDLPDESQIARLLKMRLAGAAQRSIAWNDLASLTIGLSYAEVARAANDVIKDALVSRRARVREEDIRAMLEEQATRERFGKQRA